MTFSEGMTIDLGNREVQIRHLGRGNTAGDAIVYLPKEKILVTGDLIVSPVPFMFGGYPSAFIETLRKMLWLEIDIMVPGHGEVFRGESGRAYARQVSDFPEVVVSYVSRETYRIGNGARNLEAVREAVKSKPEVILLREKFSKGDLGKGSYFDSILLSLINVAHAEITNR